MEKDELSALYQERRARTKWFMEARFGMFIHFGLYAISARGAVTQSLERVSKSAYRIYFEEFNPTRYDPRAWAKAAREAGQRYAVITTKNHDGFCLFDSKLTEYKATNTPARRDLISEFVEAFRAEGLAVGFYYSLLDWNHDDYPHYGDRAHPMRDSEEFKDKKHDFPRYVDYLHGQIRELLSNYGKIDILWPDYSYGALNGEAWRATELVAMARSLQPHIIINDRFSGNIHTGGNITKKNPEKWAGDFVTPEMVVPESCIVNEEGVPLPWEASVTPNSNYSYYPWDPDYKTPRQAIGILADCVSKNGNLLFDVAPNAKGEIPDESLQVLSTIGRWMQRNGESIYGCGASSMAKPDWGCYTQNGRNLYAHVRDRGAQFIMFKGLRGKVKRVRRLADGAEIVPITPGQAARSAGDLIIRGDRATLPDELDTVILLEL